VEIAEQVGMTLIGRMKGKRFQCLSGAQRLMFDADLTTFQDDPKSAGRKGAEHG
jgi:FdhD protein